MKKKNILKFPETRPRPITECSGQLRPEWNGIDNDGVCLHLYCFYLCSCQFIKNVGLLQGVLEKKILLVGKIPWFRDVLNMMNN